MRISSQNSQFIMNFPVDFITPRLYQKFQKFLDTQQKPKPIRKVSFFGLKAYQLKNIIEQYNLAYPDKAIIGYKSKTIDILDGIIKKAHIKIPDFKIVYVNPYTSPPNIYKKAGINQYDEENQKTYQLSLTNNKL